MGTAGEATMRSRDVVGKRIVKVRHSTLVDPEYYGPRKIVDWIELEDGTRLVAFAYETSDQPTADIIAVKPN